MRQKCVKNGSKMRQKWVLFYWKKRNVPKCVENARNTFGGLYLLDDTELRVFSNFLIVYASVKKLQTMFYRVLEVLLFLFRKGKTNPPQI